MIANTFKINAVPADLDCSGVPGIPVTPSTFMNFNLTIKLSIWIYAIKSVTHRQLAGT